MASLSQTPTVLFKIGLSYVSKLRNLNKVALKNPSWLIMFVFSRFRWARAIARFCRQLQSQPMSKPGGASVFQDIIIDDAVDDLIVEGLTPCFKLNSERLTAIQNYLQNKTCGDLNHPPITTKICEHHQFKTSNDRAMRAGYFHDDLTDPLIDGIAKDPTVLAVAQKYFNAKPIHIWTRVFWSFSVEPSQSLTSSQKGSLDFHFDPDDYQALRLFLYLSNVDDGTGPHVCVTGSHRRKKLCHLISPTRNKSDQAMVEVYGPQAIKTVTGPAGSGFLEDPFCYHKAIPPFTAPRLMMVINYAVRDYQEFRAHRVKGYKLDKNFQMSALDR